MSASGIWITGSACCWGSRRRRAACGAAVRSSSSWRETAAVYPCDFMCWMTGGWEQWAGRALPRWSKAKRPAGSREESGGFPRPAGVRRVYAVPQRLPPGPAGDGGGIGGPELLLPGLSHVFRAARAGSASGCGHDSNGTAAVSNQQNQKHGSPPPEEKLPAETVCSGRGTHEGLIPARRFQSLESVTNSRQK